MNVAEINITGDELDALAGGRRQIPDVDRTQRVQLLLDLLLEQQQLDVLAHQNHFRQAARAAQVLNLSHTQQPATLRQTSAGRHEIDVRPNYLPAEKNDLPYCEL